MDYIIWNTFKGDYLKMTEEFDSLHLENEENRPEKPNLLGVLVDILETLLLSVVLFFLINAVSARIRIDGSSMEPNLHHGEFVIVSKINYRIGEPDIKLCRNEWASPVAI